MVRGQCSDQKQEPDMPTGSYYIGVIAGIKGYNALDSIQSKNINP